MEKNIIIFFAAIFSNCVYTNKLYSNIDNKSHIDSISTIRIISCKQYLHEKGIFYDKLDTTKNELSKRNEINKIKRKFQEYEISGIYDSSIVPEPEEHKINMLFKSLYYAEDIKTILIGDTIEKYLSKYPEQYFLIYIHYGKIHTKTNFILHNIPLIILRIITLDFYRVYWTEGVSNMNFAIVDKDIGKAIYFGKCRRLGFPYDEIVINTQFEVLIEDFIKSKILLKNR